MKIEKFIHLLNHMSLFKGFTPENLLNIFDERRYEIKKYQKNSILYLQNEICLTVDLLLQGELVVEKIDRNGNSLIITSFSTGDVLGGNLVFSHSNAYPMTITTKTEAILLHIEKDLILELCQINKTFLIEFLQCISDKTLILTDKLKSVTMKTIRQRIIEFLAYEYHYHQTSTIQLKMSKRELAERLGVQRPSLSRELRKMRDEDLLDYDAKSITIKNTAIIQNLDI